MKNKKNILYIVVGFLILLIIILFILLFLPNNEEEKYLIQDFIDVDTNLLEENNNKTVESSLDVFQMEYDLKDIKEPEIYSYSENDGFYESFEVPKEQKEPTNWNDAVYEESKRMKDNYVKIDEEYVLERMDINYYVEDCLHLINKYTDTTNLEIKENEETPFTYQLDCWGDEVICRLFTVYNTKENKTEDGIAIHVSNGGMYGFTPERILYDFDSYKYNINFEENMNERFKDNHTIVPFNKFDMWDTIYRVCGWQRYGQAKLSHYKQDGVHYNKFTWDDMDDYLLMDYYTGELFQVVDGVKSSEITLFQE